MRQIMHQYCERGPELTRSRVGLGDILIYHDIFICVYHIKGKNFSNDLGVVDK